MERLKQQLAVAQQACESLQQALRQEAPPPIERDGAIQRFEYTVEAVWKATQRYLDVAKGISVGSPKDAVRRCREVGVLTDDETSLALAMIDDRNLTVHTYNEGLAQEIFGRLPQYAALLQHWLTGIERQR